MKLHAPRAFSRPVLALASFAFAAFTFAATPPDPTAPGIAPERSVVTANPVWSRPKLLPLPETTTGVVSPVISLSGTWQLAANAPERFWESGVAAEWQDLQVPASVSAQGLRPTGRIYALRRQVAIPADFAGKRVFLRLDGVPGKSQLYVNGRYVRDHFGGFTAWSADVTESVTPGELATVIVGIDRQSAGWGAVDGISRQVTLAAVPSNHLHRLQVETDLDAQYRDATLKVSLGVTFHEGSRTEVRLVLLDAQGSRTILQTAPVTLSADEPEIALSVRVGNPAKWDAEHPNLYRLRAELLQDGRIVGTATRQVGFRNIEKQGRNVLVNGRPVKLRGVNRHETHPLKGRSLTAEECWEDVRLFRDANVNLIRTSHYPANEAFLDACDALGMYVDSETNVAFDMRLQNNPAHRAQYLDQWAEMIERDRNHPSVLMWSMGNETAWGRNILDQLSYARAEDPTRPIIFSWGHLPPLAPEQTSRFPNISQPRPFDIHSLHYAYYDSNLGDMSEFWGGTSYINGWGKNFPREGIELVQAGMPVLHDESTHIPCYNLQELARDPNVRNFWGETIKRFWESLHPQEGALGMAIWAGIDEYRAAPASSNPKRVYTWGIIDAWRRPKPEYWLTKKAFSPVRLADAPLTGVATGEPLQLPVKNWFNHTNLNELQVAWKIGARSGRVNGPDVPPGGAEGRLQIPATGWTDGEVLELRFYRPGDLLVDAYHLPLNPAEARPAAPAGPLPSAEETAGHLKISGRDFALTFSRTTGQIVNGAFRGHTVIEGGPHLHLQGIQLPPWTFERLSHRAEAEERIVLINGHYGEARVSFELRIDGKGRMKTTYRLDHMPYLPPVPDVALTHATSPSIGGYEEVGVAFTLTGAIDRLAWRRKGLWSSYPDDHIGRTEGSAHRVGRAHRQQHAVRPDVPWSEDEREFELFGKYDFGDRGTRDFRSLKENVYEAAASIAASGAALRVQSNGTEAVRLQVLDDPQSLIDDADSRVVFRGEWHRYSDDHRDYRRTLSYSGRAGDAVEFTFEGTGVAWIGARDLFHGEADVYIDDVLQVSALDTKSGANWDNPTGQDKEPRVTLFSKEGLPPGRHILRIVVRGDKDGDPVDEGHIAVDAFKVLGIDRPAPVKMIIANAWNYPEVGWIRWGNYAKDSIVVGSGFTHSVLTTLGAALMQNEEWTGKAETLKSESVRAAGRKTARLHRE